MRSAAAFDVLPERLPHTPNTSHPHPPFAPLCTMFYLKFIFAAFFPLAQPPCLLPLAANFAPGCGTKYAQHKNVEKYFAIRREKNEKRKGFSSCFPRFLAGFLFMLPQEGYDDFAMDRTRSYKEYTSGSIIGSIIMIFILY